jgi:hypothetical protein
VNKEFGSDTESRSADSKLAAVSLNLVVKVNKSWTEAASGASGIEVGHDYAFARMVTR